jgi:hypothetical protein
MSGVSVAATVKNKKINSKSPTAVEVKISPSTITSCEDFYSKSWRLTNSKDLLVSLAKKSFPLKSEYETQDNFDLRSFNFLKANVPNLDKIFITLYPAKFFVYDAEKQIMSLDISRLSSEFRLDSWGNAESKYVGENAYGRKLTVTKYNSNELNVDLDSPGIDRLEVSFKIPPQEARACKEYGCSLHILGYLINVRKDFENLTPTIDEPTHFETNKTIAKIGIRCAVLQYYAKPIDEFKIDRFSMSVSP